MSTARRLLASAALAGAAAVIVSCSAPVKTVRAAEPSRSFESTHYNDKTVERYSRSADSISGTVATRDGDTVRYVARVGADELVREVELTVQPAASRGEEAQTRRVRMPKGTMPVMGASVGLLEQLLRRARAVGGEDPSIPVMHLGARVSLEVMRVRFVAPDSVILTAADGDESVGVHLTVDAQGRVLRGITPITKSRIEPVEEPSGEP